MEIKTNDQLLDELKCARYRPYIKECMKAAAAQAVKLALETAANSVTYGASFVPGAKKELDAWIDKNSILSLEQSILDKLK